MVDEADPRLLKALRELSQERELRIKYRRSAAALRLTNEKLRRGDSARNHGSAPTRQGAPGHGRAPTRIPRDSR
jgi:hypothetical protein